MSNEIFLDGNTKYVHEVETNIRKGFANKVLTQTGCLLLLTACICGAGMASSDKTQNYLLGEGQWILWLSIISSFAILISFFCFPSIFYHSPQKYFSLLLFGASLSTMCMYATIQYKVSSVLLVAGLTASSTSVLCIYAKNTKHDFTSMGGVLSVFLWILIAFGILQIWFHDQILQTLYGCLGALVFSMYIIYDMQLILGGKHHKYEYGLDDDVLATISLFLDIVNLFLQLLSLFGERK